MALKPVHLKAILFLTLGWFGVEMAGALDSVQFQLMLSRYLSDAKTIGLVLCLGPLLGVFQPLMGHFSDSLCAKGISRRAILMASVATMAVSIAVLALTWNLPTLVLAITFFYVGLNLVLVNYRALIGEVGNRQSLSYFKGTITGFIGLFTALGGLTMYLLNTLASNAAAPVVGAIVMLLAAFAVLFAFVPKAKQNAPSFLESEQHGQDRRQLLSPASLLFYVLPPLALFPAVEAKIAPQTFKKAIFRLFLTVFMLWFGIGAIRYFFVLFATQYLHLPFSQASIPLCAFTLTMLLVSVPLGKLADRIDSRIILRCTAALYLTAALYGYFFVTDLPSAIIMMVMMGASFAGNMTMPLAILFRLCPPKSEGTYLGLYNMFLCTSQIYSLLLTGWLVDLQGDYRWILLVAAASMGGALCLSARILPPDYHVVVPFKSPSDKAMQA